MFSNKIYLFFLHKNEKLKDIQCCCLTVSHFAFFFLFFQCFPSVSCYVKEFLDVLHLSREGFFSVFKENTLQYLKQIQVQIIVFNKKAAVKISRSPTQRAHHKTLLNFLVSGFSWLLDLLKTRCVFINKNSVFADWTK